LSNSVANPKIESFLQFDPWFLICSIGPQIDHQTFNFIQFDP